MTVTTEEAEMLAALLEGKSAPAGCVVTGYNFTTALRSLAVERDALQTKLDAIIIPTTYYMDPPDGGDVSIAEQVTRMYRHVCDLQAKNARLREALDFYACVDHYQIHNAAAPNVVQFDRGAKARAALGETQ